LNSFARVTVLIAVAAVALAIAKPVASAYARRTSTAVSDRFRPLPGSPRLFTSLLVSPSIPERSAPASLSAPDSPPQLPLTARGPWSLHFSDRFSENSVDMSKWSVGGGTSYGNRELEWYMPSHADVSGGVLHLKASRSPTIGTTRSGAPEIFPWASAEVSTRNSFNFIYGLVQIVARVPSGNGFWPALWLRPSNGSWPPEIDIMESWGHNTRRAAFTNIARASGGDGHKLNQQLRVDTPDLSSEFHIYTIDWEPGSIRWFLDGKPVDQVSTHVPSQSMYLIANLAIDGLPGRMPDASTPSSGSFEIQSVEVWQH
jgi:beta-glucanase (GH16 family)